MTISQLWKWIVGTLSGFGLVVTTAKSVSQIGASALWSDMNPWHFMLGLCLCGLTSVVVVACLEWLDKRFNKVLAAVAKEAEDRDAADKAEAQNRSAGEQADRRRMADIEDGLKKLEPLISLLPPAENRRSSSARI